MFTSQLVCRPSGWRTLCNRGSSLFIMFCVTGLNSVLLTFQMRYNEAPLHHFYCIGHFQAILPYETFTVKDFR